MKFSKYAIENLFQNGTIYGVIAQRHMPWVTANPVDESGIRKVGHVWCKYDHTWYELPEEIDLQGFVGKNCFIAAAEMKQFLDKIDKAEAWAKRHVDGAEW